MKTQIVSGITNSHLQFAGLPKLKKLQIYLPSVNPFEIWKNLKLKFVNKTNIQEYPYFYPRICIEFIDGHVKRLFYVNTA